MWHQGLWEIYDNERRYNLCESKDGSYGEV